MKRRKKMISNRQLSVPGFSKQRYSKLLTNIGATITRAKKNAVVAINHQLIKANWEIGRYIVQYEQQGKERAEYGKELLARLSSDLKRQYGSGFSKSSLYNSRQFYSIYPIFQTLSGKLGWSHYILLISLSDDASRQYYERQCIEENWSVRELERNINSSLYERMTLSCKRKIILKKTKRKSSIKNPADAVKDPYVLDFLGIKKNHRVTEKFLEQKIIDNLQVFLLELGKGFAFVGRQFSFPIGKKYYSIDLVFYHRVLKCFVLFDLKTRPVRHADIGQMNLYLNYFKAEENVPGDNDPIGIILSAEKDEILVEYALGGLSNRIFVSKYQLHLPDKKELKEQVKTFIDVPAGDRKRLPIKAADKPK